MIHLAAHLGVSRTEIQKKICLDVNIIGSKMSIETADAFGVSNFVNASSSEVYGRPNKKKLLKKMLLKVFQCTQFQVSLRRTVKGSSSNFSKWFSWLQSKVI